MKNNNFLIREKITNSFLIIGTAIFILAFLIVSLSSILFLCNYTISTSIFIISFLASIAYCLILSKILLPESSFNHRLYITVFFVLAMVISVGISSAFYDVSWDGQVYHQKAVYSLANNWNPYKEKVGDIWVDHYAKIPWLYAASIYKLVGHIEAGKTFNIAFILGSFMISSAALISIKRIKLTYAYLLGFIAAFNPVSIYQSLSFYVDGQLSSLLVTLASILCLFVSSQKKNLYALFLIPTIILLVNVKFTALVYSIIILSIFAIYLFLCSAKKYFYQFILISLFSLLIAALAIGYNPYVTNTQIHGHPFYPLAGKGAIDIITNQEPIGLTDKNQFQKLFISIFSKPGNYHSSNYKSSKIPLQTFSGLKEQLLTFQLTDTRIGGFGIFFSLLFLLSTFLTFTLLINRIPNKQPFLAAITILCLTVLANPACWWARYVPQLWLFSILPTVFVLTSPYRKVLLVLAKTIIFIALINIWTVGDVYIKSNLGATDQMAIFISGIAKLHPPVFIGNEDWIAPRIRLEENKIKYRVVDPKKLPCLHPKTFLYSGVSYCP